MFPNRPFRPAAIALHGLTMLGLTLLAGCGSPERGPVRIDAIGPVPAVADPNRAPLSPAAAMLLSTAAQGLVRFDATGEIEPALAQSWIVSDDGLRYIFRIRRTLWTRGEPVTAQQVAERLQAAVARNSRNPLRAVLGVIDEIEPMTDQVLEIRLKAPRPHFLQLLAQPELAILRGPEGSGPYRIGGDSGGALRLVPPAPEDEESAPRAPDILLRGLAAPEAITRFLGGQTDLVAGGTMGELPYLANVTLPRGSLVYDPAAGLFGLSFALREGPTADPRLRQALAMAIDREQLAARFEGAGFQARTQIVPGGVDELPQPAAPAWAGLGIVARRQAATAIVADVIKDRSFRLRVAMPESLGYRILFAHLRRDWATVGVDTVRVPESQEAELRLVDEVAPALLASWYLRHFTCDAAAICDPAADAALDAARLSRNLPERQARLAEADRTLAQLTPFISLGAPIRWSLRSNRLNGFRANPFARHAPINLVQAND